MSERMQGTWRGPAVAMIAALALAGCGIRGALEPPPDSQATTDTTASADSGQGKAQNAAPKPHQGFILDGLIR
jgi:predicted small lipoprotein YifL